MVGESGSDATATTGTDSTAMYTAEVVFSHSTPTAATEIAVFFRQKKIGGHTGRRLLGA